MKPQKPFGGSTETPTQRRVSCLNQGHAQGFLPAALAAARGVSGKSGAPAERCWGNGGLEGHWGNLHSASTWVGEGTAHSSSGGTRGSPAARSWALLAHLARGAPCHTHPDTVRYFYVIFRYVDIEVEIG